MRRKPSGAQRSAIKLKDITPDQFLCSLSMACPAIFESNEGSFVIIGKICDQETPQLKERIGKNEIAVEIPQELLLSALRSHISSE
jgi:hypothetical protein